MLTVLEIIKRSTEFLDKHGVEPARLNAELIIGHALGLKRMQLYLQFERPLTETELEKIRPLVKRRSNREPVQYILGEADFGGLKLKIDRRALIPRPETELLLELLAPRLATPPASVLDLGTGSGALALALAKAYPQAQVTAVDKSSAALALAGENTQTLGFSDRVRLLESDWFSALTPGITFDLIVANPPYLSDEEMHATESEVKDFEPAMALSAGPDSGAALEQIMAQAGSWLAAGGLLACETGIAQHARLLERAAQAGFSRTESLRDLTGRDRYLLAFR